MDSVFASNVVQRGFESQSGQMKHFKIDICYFSGTCSIEEYFKEQKMVGSESE
jgi:hypothetical protein